MEQIGGMTVGEFMQRATAWEIELWKAKARLDARERKQQQRT